MQSSLKLVYRDRSRRLADAFGELRVALRSYDAGGDSGRARLTRRILNRIHRRGPAFAAFCYGFMQTHGIGVARDPDQGTYWYREAAYWFERAALKGARRATTNLGVMIALGLGSGRAPERAVGLFDRAAARGCPTGRYNLALCRLHGWGVARDTTVAIGLLAEAVQGGEPAAAACLGGLYEQGVGVPRNAAEAVSLYLKAAAGGHVAAYAALGYAYGAGFGTPRDLGASVSWFELAAQAGDVYARANLALYLCRSGELSLFYRGWTLLLQGCDAGEPAAKYNLAQLLLFGAPHRQCDYGAALDLAMDLAEMGHPGGLHLIGVMYENGFGVPVDSRRAVDWYRRAARGGSAHGQAALGRLYSCGIGVRRDDAMAYYWLHLAAPNPESRAGRSLRRLLRSIDPADRARGRALLARYPAPRRRRYGLRF